MAGSRPWLAVFAASAVWGVVAILGLVAARSEASAQRSALGPDASSRASVAARAEATLVGSDDCRRCHPQQHASWHRSFHRTMTQRVGDPGVELAAPFEGEQLVYGGFVATMDRDEAGRPRVRVRAEEGGRPLLDAQVELSVGSHRYQQYVGRVGDDAEAGRLTRLPVAWHIGERRWIHLNGAFVEPESAEGDAEGWLRHLSRWNDNCVFCHNTEPVPGRLELAADDAAPRFETEVGEYGIACEACHGRGGAHVQAHANPFARMLARGQGPDPSVAQPARLSAQGEADVCGRCHGNRIARDIAEVMRKGDGFVPGASLATHSRPILPEAQIAGTEGLPFAARFWPDGRPRLSAYEYQAMRGSACHLEGELRCGDCHTMHGEDPDMQLRAEDRNAPCGRCHAPASLGGHEGRGGHGGHQGIDGRAPDCVDCHMPRVTYGLLEGMITHRIDSPDPAAWLGRADQPDACTQCHVDASRAWAAAAMPALRRGALEGSDARGRSRVGEDLFGGDPLQRNLAAHALGRGEASGSFAPRLALLIEAMDDAYPSVRWFAWRGARELNAGGGREPRDKALQEALMRFDYLAPVERRVEIVAALRERWGAAASFGIDATRREALVAGADDEGLWIGE